MFAEVEKYCIEHQLFDTKARVVIACSGGPDSMALLLFFLSVREKMQLDITVAHFEHGIRGADSLADAEYVREFCEKRQLKCYIESADVPAYAAINKISLEMAARQLRYEFLRRTAKEMGGALIATAHHADDQAETVLMRILHGSGLSGLAAMRPKNGDIIRPFLAVKKDFLEACCKQAGIAPRHDATNDSDLYLRNRLRNQLLPQLEREYNPSVKLTLCQLAEIAAADDEFIRDSLSAIYCAVVTNEPGRTLIDRSAFVKLPLAQARALLREAMMEIVPQRQILDFVQTEKLRRFIAEGVSGTRIELPFGIIAEIAYEKIMLTKRSSVIQRQPISQYELQVPGRTDIAELGITVEAEILSEPQVLSGNDWAIFDNDKISGPFYLRGRIDGDKIDISNGKKKVKDLLIDLKVPRDMRDRLPIICTAGQILWIGGIRRAATAKIDNTTKKYLLFRIIRKDR